VPWLKGFGRNIYLKYFILKIKGNAVKMKHFYEKIFLLPPEPPCPSKVI
jgi:hypothetical protein